MEKGEREDAKMSKKMPTSPFDSSSDDGKYAKIQHCENLHMQMKLHAK